MPSRQHAAAAKAAPAIVASLEVPPERIPGPEAVRSAWLRLAPDAQARIGSAALGFALYAWLSSDWDREPANRWLTDAAVCEAVVASDEALNRLLETAEVTVPELFGTAEEEEPAWARGGVVVPLLPGAASPMAAALAELERVELAGRAMEPEGWAAHYRALEAPFLGTADVLTWYAAHKPSLDRPEVCLLAKAFEAIALLFGQGTAISPAATSPLTAAIAEHRRAFAAMNAGHAEGWASGNPTDAWLALSHAEDAAFKAVLAAPCSGRADAMAFIGHIYPLVAAGPTRHPVLHDMGDEACLVAARVLEVFAAVLAEDGGPGGVRGRLS